MRNERDGWSVESAEKKGRPPPDWFLEEPEIPAHSELFLRAFLDLGTERQIGPEGVLGPIPWSRVRLYSLDKGFDRELGDAVWHIVRQMHNAETAFYAEEMRRRLSG